MKYLSIIFLYFFLAGCDGSELLTTFILVRHAEKATDGTDDPDLLPEGVDRAARLTELLKETQIDGIYTTRFKRTRATVTPLAAKKKMDIKSYESFKAEEIENMLQTHKGGTVLIAGHTNNIPWTANLLIGKESYKEYNETEYGIILIVSVAEFGKVAKVIRLNY